MCHLRRRHDSLLTPGGAVSQHVCRGALLHRHGQHRPLVCCLHPITSLQILPPGKRFINFRDSPIAPGCTKFYRDFRLREKRKYGNCKNIWTLWSGYEHTRIQLHVHLHIRTNTYTLDLALFSFSLFTSLSIVKLFYNLIWSLFIFSVFIYMFTTSKGKISE